MKATQIEKYTGEVLKALNKLMPHLSSPAKELKKPDLSAIIDSEPTHLLMAEENGHFLGTLTLAVYMKPTGKTAWIEDLVVDESARGKGVGKMLCEHAIELARSLGVQTVNLTSNPSREEANALYKKVGFQLRGSNAYSYDIK